jgi:hypothetical protein
MIDPVMTAPLTAVALTPPLPLSVFPDRHTLIVHPPLLPSNPAAGASVEGNCLRHSVARRSLQRLKMGKTSAFWARGRAWRGRGRM